MNANGNLFHRHLTARLQRYRNRPILPQVIESLRPVGGVIFCFLSFFPVPKLKLNIMGVWLEKENPTLGTKKEGSRLYTTKLKSISFLFRSPPTAVYCFRIFAQFFLCYVVLCAIEALENFPNTRAPGRKQKKKERHRKNH